VKWLLLPLIAKAVCFTFSNRWLLINSAIVTFNVRIAVFNCCEALVRIGYELKKIIGMNTCKLGIVGI
jgi:hypothetical protein